MYYSIRFAAILLPVLSLAAPAALIEERQDWGQVTSASGLSFYQRDPTTGTNGQADPSTYTCYSGPASHFPDISEWISFENMWKLVVADILTPVKDSPTEQDAILKAVKRVGHNAKIDPRVILATIVDESTGNVRVGCTNNGVQNCGLMQSHNPEMTSFNDADPYGSVLQMVRDGVRGTPSGDGLLQLFNNEAKTGGNLWNVFRAYNSGSIDESNLSNPVGATAAYVSNMANYLSGWNGWGVGPSACNF